MHGGRVLGICLTIFLCSMTLIGGLMGANIKFMTAEVNLVNKSYLHVHISG